MNRDLLTADLVRDEGLRLKPYVDTVGKLSIGIGRNLDDVGITKAEAYMLAAGDIEGVERDLDRSLTWWRDLSEPRQRAVANLCFNLGISRLLGFKRALAALKAGDYERSADEFLDSLWARQVKARATRVTDLIRRG